MWEKLEKWEARGSGKQSSRKSGELEARFHCRNVSMNPGTMKKFYFLFSLSSVSGYFLCFHTPSLFPEISILLLLSLKSLLRHDKPVYFTVKL